MSEIQEAINGLTISLEHADGAHGLGVELKDLQTKALGYGGVAQNQLEIAVNGLPHYMNQVELASENSCGAFDDSEKAIQLLTHGTALSKEMGDLDELTDSVSQKLFYTNFHREAALRTGATPLSCLEAALTSFDLFTGKLNEAIHAADTIGTKIGDAKDTVMEVMPKSNGLVGITAYLTYIRHAEWSHNNHRGHLLGAENHIPETGRQLIVDVIDGLKKSMGLLGHVEGKNIESLNEAVVEAKSVVFSDHQYVPALQALVESVKKGVDTIQGSGNETAQFQETTQSALQTALEDGRKILGVL